MSIKSPNSRLVDENGQPLASEAGTPADSALTVQTDPAHPLDVDKTGLATSAKQDTAQTALDAIKTAVQAPLAVTDGGGSLTVDGSVSVSNFPATQTVAGSVAVSNFPATQPVSAASLPLPTGAATETTLAAVNTKLGGAIHVDDNGGSLTVDSAQLPGTLDSGNLRVAVENTPAVTVSGTPNVAVTSSALPTGASTSALQTTGNTSLGNIDTKTPALVSGRVPVDPSGVTSPVSVSSLPLPAGASTAALQTTGNASLASIDAKLTSPIAVTGGGGGTQYADGAAVATPTGTVALGHDGTNVQAIKTDSSGRVDVGGSLVIAAQGQAQATNLGGWPVHVTNTGTGGEMPVGDVPSHSIHTYLSDGSGAGVGNGNRATIKPPSTLAASTDTALVVTQRETVRVDPTGTTIQPVSGTVAVSNFPATQPVSGTVSVSNFPATQPISAASLPLPSGASTAAKQPALGTAGTASTDVLTVQGIASMTALKVDGSAVTQPVSGTVSITGTPNVAVTSSVLPTGAATAAKQPALGTAGTPSTDVITVQGAASMTALKVDGSAVTQPVSASSLPLPTGASTETTLASINTKTPTVGQKTMSASSPVTIASDQTSIPVAATISGTPSVSVSNFPATQPISATALPLPSGAAQDATLTGGSAKSIVRGGAKGSTTAADVTSTASGANHNALDVVIYDTTGNPITTFGGSASVGTNNAAAPTSSTQVGGSDGTNIQAARVFDADSGAGTQYVLGVTLRKSASGGSVEAGTSSDPIRVDPTGTTTQPVSGTVTANLGTIAGVATETTLATRLADATFTARVNTLGQKTMANSTPVVLASDQSSIPVSSSTLATNATLTGGTQVTKITDAGGTNTATMKAAFTSPTGAETPLVVVASPNTDIVSGSVAVSTTTSTAINTFGMGSFAFELSGTWSGSFVVESAIDGGTPSRNLVVYNVATGAAVDTSVTPITTNGRWVANVTSTSSVRVRSTALTSGSAALYMRANINPLDLSSGSSSASQGTAAALSGAWPVKVTDGTNTMPTMDAVGRAGFQKITDGTNTASVSASSALKVDGSAVTQPVSGTVTANLGTIAGVATETTLASRLADATFTARINTLGQKTMANSTPVVLASDQASISVAATISGTPTVTANIGTSGSLALDATLTGGTARAKITDGTTNTAVKAASTAAVATDPALVVALSPNSNNVNSSTLTQQGSLSSATDGVQLLLNGRTSVQIVINLTSFTGTLQAMVTDTISSLSAYWYDNGPSGAAYGVWTSSSVFVASSQAQIKTIVVPAGTHSVFLRCSAYTSGSLTYAISASNAQHAFPNLTTSLANPLKITDGTNTAAVKAASTAPATTDPALVVALSPNFTGPATATLTATAVNASSVTVLSSNTARQTATLINDSTIACYVKFGSTASSTSYSYYMPGSSSGVPATLEIPCGINGPYTGIITAIWASAGSGNMRVTEVSA